MNQILFSISLSLQAFNNDGQEVVFTKDRQELEDREITGIFSHFLWVTVLILDIGFSGKNLRLEIMQWTTQILHSKDMREKLQVILKAQVWTFSSVSKRLFEQWSLSFMVNCPTQIAQVLRMKISVSASSSRIQQVRYILSFRDCLWPWKYETDRILILMT